MEEGVSFDLSSDDDCIFKHPFENIQKAKHLTIMLNFQNEFSNVLQTENNREQAIIAACLLELQIDEILKSWIPEYSKIAEEKETTFNYKIKMCKSNKLIPDKIFEAAHIFRNIRNDFAHNILSTTFDNLENKEKYHDQIKTVIRKLSKKYNFQSFQDDYKMLFSIIHIGLNTYIEHVKYLSMIIRNTDILENITKAIRPPEDSIVGIQEKDGFKKFDKPVTFTDKDIKEDSP
ncbi:MAG: DUF4145 domain-containing protein [Spirochaetales bacterium]|nr:DUF4145 domain-containing protein [Spirochaetales bacterium]